MFWASHGGVKGKGEGGRNLNKERRKENKGEEIATCVDGYP